MELKPITPTAKAPAANFTGDVYLNPIYRGEDPSRMIVSQVRFTRARTLTGIPTPLARPCTSQTESAWSSPATAPSFVCVPATPSTPRQARSTGTAPQKATSCATWPCSKAPATATAPPGSNPVTDDHYKNANADTAH